LGVDWWTWGLALSPHIRDGYTAVSAWPFAVQVQAQAMILAMDEVTRRARQRAEIASKQGR
jgi:hypothetical protein